MQSLITFNLKSFLRHDLPAGITVFFVALPLCLGISVASGAPLGAGIIAGIAGGLIAASIGKSTLSVSGPAAGLTSIVAASIATAGSYDAFLPAVFLAGAIQLFFGVARIGGFANYLPSAVVRGMLAGIGILLVVSQVPTILGYSGAHFWKRVFSSEFRTIIGSSPLGAIAIGALSLVLLLAIEKIKHPAKRFLPAPLLVVIVATIAASFTDLSPAQFVRMPQTLLTGIHLPSTQQIFHDALVWKIAFTIAVVASIETLLSLEAIDKLDPRKRTSPPNRELIAQGFSNIASGLAGGLPVTAVIVRGAANIEAGAKTRLSSIVHGLLLFSAAMFLARFINLIPYPALGAILLFTGYKLIKPPAIIQMWQKGAAQFLPFVVTLALVAAADLLIGVIAGLAVSVAFIVHKNLRIQYKVEKRLLHETPLYHIKLHVNVSFLNKIRLKRELDRIPPYSILRIDASETQFMDYDVLETISEFQPRAHDRHIQLEFINLKPVDVNDAH